MSNLRFRLSLHSIEDILIYNRLRWYCHLKRMDNDRWSNKIMDYNITGTHPRGRSKKEWLDNIKHDLPSLHLNEGNIVNRIERKNAVTPSTCLQISRIPVYGETRALNRQ